MDRSAQDVWLHRFAWGLAVATLGLIVLGGAVTTKGVGMAVPDWPRTYGDHMFLFPPSKWIAGVFFEHSHRLWASLVGLFCGIFAIWTWWRGTTGRARSVGISAMVLVLALLGVRHQPGMFVGMAVLAVFAMIWAAYRAVNDPDRLRWLGVIALAAVIIQGVFGGLRVLLDEKWGMEFGILHAALAQIFLLLVGTLVLMTSSWWGRATVVQQGGTFRRVVLATTLLIFLQLMFGATMRHQHAGLAVPDLPLAYGKLWPDTDSVSIAMYNSHRIEAAGEDPITAGHVVVHMLHRYTGVVIAALILVAAMMAFRREGSLVRRYAGVWIALALVQVTLGILTITSDRKVDVTTAHVAVGALTFLVGWICFLVSSRTTSEAQESIARSVAMERGAELKHA